MATVISAFHFVSINIAYARPTLSKNGIFEALHHICSPMDEI